ncbi:MAG: HAD family hydrolase [Acidobacteriia bacterium]|nr:HAD family hydrolase [Terriglobia bacterium]
MAAGRSAVTIRPAEGVLFEPVGCLAEFPSEPFHEIACRVFDLPRRKPSRSASRAWWHLLNLLESSGQRSIELLELEAVAASILYEDVQPALTQLKTMGIRLAIASSLSQTAVECFLAKHNLAALLDEVWSRDNSGGIKSLPLRRAAASGAIFLADTLEAIHTAKAAGLSPVLMMNDPDEARRLAMHDPAGGIVSLHELPDFVKLVEMQATPAPAAPPSRAPT